VSSTAWSHTSASLVLKQDAPAAARKVRHLQPLAAPDAATAAPAAAAAGDTPQKAGRPTDASVGKTSALSMSQNDVEPFAGRAPAPGGDAPALTASIRAQHQRAGNARKQAAGATPPLTPVADPHRKPSGAAGRNADDALADSDLPRRRGSDLSMSASANTPAGVRLGSSSSTPVGGTPSRKSAPADVHNRPSREAAQRKFGTRTPVTELLVESPKPKPL
jgi:hypothetical protein